ncbi:MAG: hypothetical protein JWN98_589 [Abditibacteriota bacterium]|nr:hypothetical protein [Abditibacteriota bacterium]
MRDQQGLAADVALPRVFGPLLSLFDGTRDVAEIVTAFQMRGGEELPVEFVENFIRQLDEALLLDSPHFVQHRRDLMSAWNDSPTRPAAFAGLSYPADPDDLRELLNELFADSREIVPSRTLLAPPDARVRGVVVPHIDFGRGGEVEALAYRPLLREQFDTLVVFGIAHSGIEYPFCATSKDYETPLGVCRTDREFVAALQERVGPRLKAEQWAHKNEHSIEFVAVFLQHLQNLQSPSIVPILCGGFFRELQSGRSPLGNPTIAEFVDALRDVTQHWEASGKRVGFVVSVDLAHVGSQFGDDTPLTPQRLADIESQDLEFLHAFAEGDLDGVHQTLARDGNARNVDAHPAAWTVLAAFPALRGQLLHYKQAHTPAQNIVVSMAAMSLFEPAN